ncbi:Ankyrin repeat-containing protein NPR4 [Camellia lanceoleosa]|uniref:Ankyrin repeat-containing protein NPR4 n=1 Tax=Camellia lanceoleosa TaxID=1840588 RepID=A0ACC0I2P0_9ERIC|nr:Ankyrin repeat-containing protein NPR4 [Camellia lanceoleosa]
MDADKKNKYWRYIPLLNAVLRGEWDSAKRFFNEKKETMLHVAVASGRSIDFVEKLVDLMPPEALALPNRTGATALHHPAWIGNTKAAVILVEKHPAPLYIFDNNKWLPLHHAADKGHEDTLSYLLSVTKDDPVSMPFAYSSGALLISKVVYSEFYDIALNLVGRYPELAMSKLDDGYYALKDMVLRPSAFPSGSHLNGWQRLIYHYVPVKLENYADQDHNRSDIENASEVITQKYMNQKLQAMLWKVFELLVKFLCEKIRSLNDSNAYESLCEDVILIATKLGIHEVVEEIIESFPEAVWTVDAENHDIFQLAVLNRCENVFNLIYRMSRYKQAMMAKIDNNGDSILHLVGRLAPNEKLSLIPSAALQMQRELQWFQEIEKFVIPYYKGLSNKNGEIPSMTFTKEHNKLVEKGEKWMKDTANSCTITAALIATIGFAAAITVPSGNEGTSGLPILSEEKAFVVFIISDAISLFTSTTSLLMFLSILTSRYAEVAALACLLVTSFVSLQFPLLVDLISSTYGPGIFGKQSDRLLY